MDTQPWDAVVATFHRPNSIHGSELSRIGRENVQSSGTRNSKSPDLPPNYIEGPAESIGNGMITWPAQERYATASAAYNQESSTTLSNSGIDISPVFGQSFSMPTTVSSGSSDVTDLSVTQPDSGHYTPALLLDQTVTSSFGGFAIPAPHPTPAASSVAFNPDHPWTLGSQAPCDSPYGCANPFAVHVGDSSNNFGTQSKESGYSHRNVPAEMDPFELPSPIGEAGPVLSSQPMSRKDNSSRTVSLFSIQATDSSSNAFASPHLSALPGVSRRSSLNQADGVSIASGLSLTVSDYASFGPVFHNQLQSPMSPEGEFMPHSARYVAVESPLGNRFSRLVSLRSLDQPSFSEADFKSDLIEDQLDPDAEWASGHSPDSLSAPRRGSEEMDIAYARDNQLYRVGPSTDGLYHCPYEGEEGCEHKPNKLKCTYDKYVDSHLKPYRCKALSCGDQQFSSTACLLRHEREAHGMHGHGTKPYACPYAECDRSVSGKGFPRRWNLLDHMRRVHDYTGPTSNGSDSPACSPPGAKATALPSAKRKLSTGQKGARQQGKKAKAKSASRPNQPNAPDAPKASQVQLTMQLRTLNDECSSLHSRWRRYAHELASKQTLLRSHHLDVQIKGIQQAAAEIDRLEVELRQVQPGTEESTTNVKPD
ncbi:MAG: hypothetical protein M1825_002698 [Sarcosagium campestre]|nr:MAG: hypothetical protein M1825_002698 [Sarcosagium campestre]